MATRSRPTFSKRQKEQARAEKARRKEEKRAERLADKENRRPTEGGEDPDIAHIVPGPQPLPWEDEEEEAAASDPDRRSVNEG